MTQRTRRFRGSIDAEDLSERPLTRVRTAAGIDSSLAGVELERPLSAPYAPSVPWPKLDLKRDPRSGETCGMSFQFKQITSKYLTLTVLML